MSSLAAILAECARLASGAGVGAVASVARRRGSLPMASTAKLLVTAGGARMGTVGGGCLEAEVIERCLDVIERRSPSVSEHELNAELAGDYGLTCGGIATIVVEPVYPDATLAAAYTAAADVVRRGDRALMTTGLDWSGGPHKSLRRLSAHTRQAGADAASDTENSVGTPLDAEKLPSLEHGILTELVAAAPRLVVFGGGHVGGAIARAATAAGWRVTVVDDREDFTDAARHPTAERRVTCDWHDLPPTLDLDDASWCVVATRGHQHDALIVDQLARRDLRYLGMLGSRRKVALTWKLLDGWGVPPERLDRVHAPIGLAIGADTPEEIAVSVVAEMIAVRRSGSRRRGGVELMAGQAEGGPESSAAGVAGVADGAGAP